jgi:TonB family protein
VGTALADRPPLPHHDGWPGARPPPWKGRIFMKQVMFLIAGLLLVSSLPTQAAQMRARTYLVGADVDASGHITATQIDADVPADIADVLASAVKQWAFVPATRDGEPVRAYTFVRAKLQVAPDASGHSTVRIYFMGNGPKLDETNVSPSYPRDAARAHQQAFVMLDATVQPDGSLTDMTVHTPSRRWPLQRAFTESVLVAARQWHAIPERVDGQAVATRMRIPLDFTLSTQPLSAAQADSMRETLREEVSTAKAESSHFGDLFQSDQPVSLDSPLQPRTLAASENAH